jgi:signal transduction histidine kinase
LIVDIAREAITNAVRHGFATEVHIHADYADGTYRLKITDNGRPAAGEIKEGVGIGGMRRRLAQFGGELAVVSEPNFTLTVTIPGSAGDPK